nr:hypothetical protein [Burkholderia metallica]
MHASAGRRVLSPHLAVAAFSRARLLAAAPGSVVVTGLAGIAPRDTRALPSDRRAGSRNADEAVHVRHDEHRRALARLGAPAGSRADGAAAKAAVFATHASLVALFDPHIRANLHGPQTYWRLERDVTFASRPRATACRRRNRA